MFKIILTGATGMVGEGVLLHCLTNKDITEVLMINRRHFSLNHPKLKELLVPDFNDLGQYQHQLAGYDACFYCAGVSVIGKTEEEYTRVTYSTTLRFAEVLYAANPDMIFNYVSGAQTNADGTLMWQRVKGKTEKDLEALGFQGQYNFRPGVMKPVKGQKNIRWFLKPLIALIPLFTASKVLTLRQVGQAMINTITKGYHQNILEIADIKELA